MNLTFTDEEEAFRQEVRELRRNVLGASKVLDEIDQSVKHLRQALVDTPEADLALMVELEGRWPWQRNAATGVRETDA